MGAFNPRKRRREASNIDVRLVELYDDLAHENNEIRLKAAKELLSRFTPDKNAPDEDIEKVLKRLVRGLCSSRKAARVGFSIALTELLSQVFTVGNRPESSELNIQKAIDILDRQTNPFGCSSGQEERDHFFGRVFGSEAIFKSGILYQEDVSFEHWTRMLSLVFDLSKKKPWLKEECGFVAFFSIRDIATRKLDPKYAQEIIRLLCESGLAKTPEGVATWLAATAISPPIDFVSDVWYKNNPLSAREKSTLAKIMKESSDPKEEQTAEDGKKAKNSGVWNPKLHFAWEPILANLYGSAPVKNKKEGKSSKHSQVSFEEFWVEVVDNGLFAASSSNERKYWGFLVVMKVLNDAPKEVAASIFTKNFMRCLINQLGVEDRNLHRLAQKTAKAIQARGEKDPEFISPALQGLMGPAGAVNFDQVTKTKTVEKLIGDCTTHGLDKIVPFLEDLIIKPGVDDSKAAASRRQQLGNLLFSIVKSLSTKSNVPEGLNSTIERIIVTLARLAYFAPDDEDEKTNAASPEPPIIQATQEFFQNKISSCLNIVIAGRKDAATVATKVVQNIRSMEQDGEHGKFIIDMSDAISGSIEAAFKTLKKINHKEKHNKGKEMPSAQALKLLYAMTIFQVYNGDADAVSMLEELKLCYDKFFGVEKGEEDDVAEASDILVEILLSFASKQSQLFRRTSEQVFGAFADKITATGLESLLSILEAKDNLSGQEEMFEKDEEGSDVDMLDADDISGSDASDVEVVDGPSDSGSDDDEDEEEEDEDEESDDEAAQAELEEFDAELAAALGTHRGDQDADAASSDEDGSDMDDDQMEALDAQLAKVFKARSQETNKKKEKKEARENMVNFKNRALDLLEIYVKKSHSNIIATNIILPLLQIIRKSKNQQIAVKASNVLREYSKQCKGTASLPTLNSTADNGQQVKDTWALLRSVHQEATHSGPSFHSSSCSQASLLLVKILTAHDKETVGGIVDIYSGTRKMQLLSKKCHVQPSFFSDWNNWCVSASKQFKG